MNKYYTVLDYDYQFFQSESVLYMSTKPYILETIDTLYSNG